MGGHWVGRSAGGACGASPSGTLDSLRPRRAHAVQDSSIDFGRAPGIGHMPDTGPIWLTCGCTTSPPCDPYGPLGRLGAIKPTTAAPARFIRDQRFGGFFICWSCGCCPVVFVCGSDFAGFCIGFCGSGERFRFGFFWIAEDDLTFGFFGFFTGSASAFCPVRIASPVRGPLG